MPRYLIQRVTPRTNASFCRANILILEAETKEEALAKFRFKNIWVHDLYGVRYEAILLTDALEAVAKS